MNYYQKYYVKHKQQFSERAKLWYKTRGKTLMRIKSLKSFNLSLDQYNELFKRQNGLCLGCYQHQSVLKRALNIDHNHKCCNNKRYSCGKCIRGLLCSSCNSALGYVKDNPQILRRLADYLER